MPGLCSQELQALDAFASTSRRTVLTGVGRPAPALAHPDLFFHLPPPFVSSPSGIFHSETGLCTDSQSISEALAFLNLK